MVKHLKKNFRKLKNKYYKLNKTSVQKDNIQILNSGKIKKEFIDDLKLSITKIDKNNWIKVHMFINATSTKKTISSKQGKGKGDIDFFYKKIRKYENLIHLPFSSSLKLQIIVSNLDKLSNSKFYLNKNTWKI